MKLFQIYEGDLAKLETALPTLFDATEAGIDCVYRDVLIEEVKEILANVRSNYGPHTNVQVIDAS
jgi:hypothetical protein